MAEQQKETYRRALPNIKNFSYTHVSYGLPFAESCVKHVRETFRANRVYIIASTTLSQKTSAVRDLETALGNRHVKTWVGIRAHTPWDDLVPIINDMRIHSPDLLVTLGGGSLADGAKVISYALANGVSKVEDLDRILATSETDQDGGAAMHIRDRDGVGNNPTLPLIFIPTTLSGGEFSCYAGSTNPITRHKPVMRHAKTFASLVVLDPQLAVTTPEWVWISTGIRAIDHCVETLCAENLPYLLRDVAAQCLATLVKTLLKSKEDPLAREPRLECMIAVGDIITGKLLFSPLVFTGASHGIGHQLGPLGVGHGQTSCILLPAVLKFNLSAAHSQMAKQNYVKETIWGCDEGVRRALMGKAQLDPNSSDASSTLRAFFDVLGMPSTLKSVGVERNHFDSLAINSLDDFCTAANPVPVSKTHILQILEMVAE